MRTKLPMISLMLWLASGSLVSAQDNPLALAVPVQNNLPDNRPLNPGEVRQVIGFMIELDTKDAQLKLTQQALDQEKTFEQRQTDLAAKELDLEKQGTALAQHSADIEKTRADEYQALWKEATKKIGNSFGCHLKKLFTLGLGKCT